MHLSGGDINNNPYHYILHAIGGKWKMTLMHGMDLNGSIRFNQTLKTLPISEKVLAQQLRELTDDGLVERKVYDGAPQRVEYTLTEAGRDVLPAADYLYQWAVNRMKEMGLSIDEEAFAMHYSDDSEEASLKRLQEAVEGN